MERKFVANGCFTNDTEERFVLLLVASQTDAIMPTAIFHCLLWKPLETCKPHRSCELYVHEVRVTLAPEKHIKETLPLTLKQVHQLRCKFILVNANYAASINFVMAIFS